MAAGKVGGIVIVILSIKITVISHNEAYSF
jgi:hypothetical protein